MKCAKCQSTEVKVYDLEDAWQYTCECGHSWEEYQENNEDLEWELLQEYGGL